MTSDQHSAAEWSQSQAAEPEVPKRTRKLKKKKKSLGWSV